MTSTATKVKITTIRFKNYKALRNFSITLQSMNLLVGPNNSGKSTILSGLRILEYAMKIARSKTAIRVRTSNGEFAYGHHIPESNIPSSLENVHSDYSDEDSTIEFNISNGNKLTLYFPHDSGCVLHWATVGKTISSPSGFKSQFPINIRVVPVLGPLEQEEPIVTDETIRRAAGTPRASRHFRNYWHRNQKDFPEFRKMLETTWIGMSVKFPEINVTDRRLLMFCTEERIDRELYWSGFGFQIWCQLLTHLVQSSEANLVVVDEPEVYLHPDIQRQLLTILRHIAPDVLLATHSIEILGEADPTEILLVDKTKTYARRLKDVEGIQTAIIALGSIQNITLTHLARTKKILFTEGADDYKLLRRFATVVGLSALASGTELTALESGGFSSWDKIKSLAWGLKNTIGADIRIGAIYDRDYWCLEEINVIRNALTAELTFAHIHRRKEIENYLLIPAILARVVEKSRKEREKNGVALIKDVDTNNILDNITTQRKAKIQGQYVAKHLEFHRQSGIDVSQLTTEALQRFEELWLDLETRMQIVPGKEILKAFRDVTSEKWGISFSDIKIIAEFTKAEIPQDLSELLDAMDAFRMA